MQPTTSSAPSTVLRIARAIYDGRPRKASVSRVRSITPGQRCYDRQVIVVCPRCGLALDVGAAGGGAQVRCRCTAAVDVPFEPKEAGGLRCPGCGADARDDATECAYCKAALAPLLCARCFSRNFHGSHNCAACGAVLPLAVEPAGRTDLPCPGCAKTLERRVSGGFGVECCPACGGVFLDHDTDDRIYASIARKSSAVTATGPRKRTIPVTGSHEPVQYKRCPHCADIMTRKLFARGCGVILDVCGHHGTWFDPGELRQVIAFVESGGLEDEERRKIEDLRQEASRVRDQQAALAGMPWAGAGGGYEPPHAALGSVLFDAAAAIARWLRD